MDKQPSIDRELLLPILVGGFSILGIIMILLIGRLNASRASVVVVETETPFKYIFLGTEPVLSPESPEASETELLTDSIFDGSTPPPPGTFPAFGTPTLRTTALVTQNTTSQPTDGTSPVNTTLPTSTSASGAPLNSGTYDDIDSHLVYNGSGWAAQEVDSAYKGTLHVSQVPGSSVTFKFIGTEVRFGYQIAASLGTVTVRIDNTNYDPIDQSDTSAAINEWISPGPLSSSSHTVTITHASGGSVNLDYVIVPEVAPTGAPTATPTRTPTP
jgi:hypothetical protein